MKFIVRLNYPYSDLIQKDLLNKDYEVVFNDKILHDLIIVEKSNGSIEELKKMEYVKSARKERQFHAFV